jgi:transcriptional regulator with XRE-family HTH domain
MYSGRFSIRLRKLREKAGLTIPEIAALTAIPVQTLYNWERNKATPPIDVFPILAEAYGVKVRTLLPEK